MNFVSGVDFFRFVLYYIVSIVRFPLLRMSSNLSLPVVFLWVSLWIMWITRGGTKCVDDFSVVGKLMNPQYDGLFTLSAGERANGVAIGEVSENYFYIIGRILIMNTKKAVAAALFAVGMATVPSMVPFGDVLCAYAEAGEDCVYENRGLKLTVPRVYDNLVMTKVLEDDEEGRLFSVTEAASVAGAWSQHDRGNGAGWLFSIGRVRESRLHEMLCSDMSGADVFAKDKNGNYYIFYHPTDVRYVRQDADAMRRDAEQWTELTGWAHREVPPVFIQENGLTVETYDNSSVSMTLARIAYKSGTQYTISTTKYGPLSSDEVDAVPYVERLIRGATYRTADIKETPDGEYVVLDFPEAKVRYDFFKLSGKENYIREVREDGYESLYEVSFADATIKASSVMQRWYNELAAHR